MSLCDEADIFLLLLLMLSVLFYMPSKDIKIKNKAIIEGVCTLIHESFTTANNMQ